MKSYSKFFTAFTLAEMMVVLLIMSIVLACMAPVMTTKMKSDQSIQTSPWRWSENNVDAYFSAGSNQAAMIGQNAKSDTDSAKLIINNSTNLDNLILFKNGNNVLGRLGIAGNSLLLGTLRSGTDLGSGATVVGRNVNASGSYSTSMGYNNEVSGNYSTSVGYNNTVKGNNSIAIGYWVQVPHNYSVAIGYGTASGETSSGTNQGWSTAIGYNTRATGYASVAYGAEAKALGNRSVALGSTSKAVKGEGDGTISIGSYSYSSGSGSVAIGTYSCTKGVGSVALSSDNCERDWSGNNSLNESKFKTHNYATGIKGGAYSDGAVAIGPWTMVYGDYGIGIGSTSEDLFTSEPGIHTYIAPGASRSIAIGQNARIEANATDSVSIGTNTSSIGAYAVTIGSGAVSRNTNNIAIGKNACVDVFGPNKICIGANSGPSSGHAWAGQSDTAERIFIGSQSKFNNAPAVLEVHNTGNHVAIHNGAYSGSDASVIINGNLIVKGTIMSHVVDRYGNYVQDFRVLERYGEGENNASLHGGIGETSGFMDYFNIGGGSGWRSDRRLKYVGKENLDGLEKLRQLKVFNYTFKKDENKTPRVGVMAQDLQKVFPNAVKKGADGFLTIRWEDMFYAVINAIKELDARVTALEKENKLLKEQNKALDARLKALEAKIK